MGRLVNTIKVLNTVVSIYIPPYDFCSFPLEIKKETWPFEQFCRWTPEKNWTWGCGIFSMDISSQSSSPISSSVSQIASFMRSTWGPPGNDMTQVGPMLAPWTLLSGVLYFLVHPRFLKYKYWCQNCVMPISHHERLFVNDNIYVFYWIFNKLPHFSFCRV